MLRPLAERETDRARRSDRDRFRHQHGEELFEIDVLFPDDGDVTGTVRCTVEAENLTKPVELLIPVSRRVESYSLMAIADEMVERCGCQIGPLSRSLLKRPLLG